MNTDKNCLSYWFPKLEAAGLPVPQTTVIHCPRWTELIKMLDGEDVPELELLASEIHAAAKPYGFPFFLRTGQTSGKHNWDQTCFVPDADSIPTHIGALVEFSELCCIFGLPYDVWAVREFLHLEYTFTAFCGMPVAKERRYFIRDGRIQCSHFYWPQSSLEGHTEHPDWKTLLAELQDESKEMPDDLALQAAQVFTHDEPFSLDIAKTADGRWIIIDMALAANSFHWESCPFDPAMDGQA